MPYKIQHLGINEVLGQAVVICRDHFAVLFKIVLLLLVPFGLIVGFVSLAITPELPSDYTMQDLIRVQEAQFAHWPFFLITGLFQAFVLVPLTNASLIRAVARIYLNQPVSVVGSVREGLRRLLPLIGTTILMTLAVLGGFLLLIVPGVLFALWFGLAQQVVVLEELSGTRALGRSKRLIRNRMGTFLLVILVMIVITVVSALGSKLIPQPHLQLIVTTILQDVTNMFWIVVCTVFYFSCRSDAEEPYLQQLAASMGALPAE